VDQIVKGIQNSKNHKSLPSIDEDYMEETSYENSKDQRKIKIIRID